MWMYHCPTLPVESKYKETALHLKPCIDHDCGWTASGIGDRFMYTQSKVINVHSLKDDSGFLFPSEYVNDQSFLPLNT